MKAEPPNMVLSEKRGRIPRYSAMRITHQGEVRLAVMMPSISALRRPLRAIAWQLAWGLPGAWPLTGDYDGDRRSDFAVFEPAAARWYVLGADQATALAWQLAWGRPGYWPVGAP